MAQTQWKGEGFVSQWRCREFTHSLCSSFGPLICRSVCYFTFPVLLVLVLLGISLRFLPARNSSFFFVRLFSGRIKGGGNGKGVSAFACQYIVSPRCQTAATILSHKCDIPLLNNCQSTTKLCATIACQYIVGTSPRCGFVPSGPCDRNFSIPEGLFVLPVSVQITCSFIHLPVVSKFMCFFADLMGMQRSLSNPLLTTLNATSLWMFGTFGARTYNQHQKLKSFRRTWSCNGLLRLFGKPSRDLVLIIFYQQRKLRDTSNPRITITVTKACSDLERFPNYCSNHKNYLNNYFRAWIGSLLPEIIVRNCFFR